jgi:hypothetical protein
MNNSPSQKPWPYNPLVTLIRLHSVDVIAQTIQQYEKLYGFKASHFDLIIQVMIVACSHAPNEVWHSKTKDVAIASEYIQKGAPDMALDILETSIKAGNITLNTDLIQVIAQQQAARLHTIHESHKNRINLPAHEDNALKHFQPGAELKALRLVGTHDPSKPYQAVAIEKTTSEKVYFRPIDLSLSRAYIESFHYLHTARDDDLLAFGAFIENEKMPFAIVSYAPVSRIYKQNILIAAGIDPQKSLELTRAWNSEYSPKNTMSMLYSFAHAYIQQQQSRQDLEAILTAVNPNLGFKGSAFRAVGFGLVGEKPTAYHYIVDKKGQRSFTLRRSLVAFLKKKPFKAQIRTSSLPLLPTKELAVILEGRKRFAPILDVVYSVSEAEYQREAGQST